MTDADEALRCGVGAFSPLEVAQLRCDADAGEARFEGLDAEDMLAEPGGGSAGPAVAKAVPEAFVAVGAEVAMDILLAGRDKFVDAGGIGDPIEVEILPEGGGSEVEHGAPVSADEIEGGLGVAGFGQCLQHIEAVEGGDAFRSVELEDGIGGWSGIDHAGQGEEGGAGLGPVDFGDDLASAGGGVGAELGGAGVAEGGEEAGAAFEGHDQQALEAGGYALGIGGTGPVEEAEAVDTFLAIGADELGEAPEERGEVRLLGFEVRAVGVMEPEILVDDHPPHGIAGDAVHPFGDGGDVAGEIERAWHDFVEAEDGMDGTDFGVHVADPDQAIAFDAVPEVFLHVEMNGIGAHLPDLIEPLVVGAEGTEVRKVTDLEHGAHLAEFNRELRVRVVDADEAEAAGADHFFAEPGQGDRLVTDSVVVLGVLVAAEFGHCLGSGLAEADADVAQSGLFGGHGGDQFDVASQFASEIEEDTGGGVGGGGQSARGLWFAEEGLAGVGFQERRGMLRAGVGLPDEAGGGEIEGGKGRFLG